MQIALTAGNGDVLYGEYQGAGDVINIEFQPTNTLGRCDLLHGVACESTGRFADAHGTAQWIAGATPTAEDPFIPWSWWGEWKGAVELLVGSQARSRERWTAPSRGRGPSCTARPGLLDAILSSTYSAQALSNGSGGPVKTFFSQSMGRDWLIVMPLAWIARLKVSASKNNSSSHSLPVQVKNALPER